MVFGLKPGKHGFHVHINGNLSDSCKAAGGPFNPFNDTNGHQNHAYGNFGDLHTPKSGITRINIIDKQISLYDHHSIVGRAVVIHSGPTQTMTCKMAKKCIPFRRQQEN
ncbi:copper/zinc superoxide dismutase [Ancylostoma ceylanicum]|uniref:Copper/zinc superoxide dismutase n=1 Tax=Ancylostoma ceylanicum TaxID=53326 RepID=A0A0D6LTT0_9BILA|nr:copper/zinc superoxide dismutase [Ancylostoma ceylanicum]